MTDSSCICSNRAHADYEGPLKECPIHGDQFAELRRIVQMMSNGKMRAIDLRHFSGAEYDRAGDAALDALPALLDRVAELERERAALVERQANLLIALAKRVNECVSCREPNYCQPCTDAIAALGFTAWYELCEGAALAGEQTR